MYLGRSHTEAISESQTPGEMNHSNRDTPEGQGPRTPWPQRPGPLPGPPQPSFPAVSDVHLPADPLPRVRPHPIPILPVL